MMAFFIIFMFSFVLFISFMSKAAHADEIDYTEEITEMIREFLSEDDWHFDFDDENGCFTFNISIDGKLQHLRYVIYVKDDGYTVYAVSPLNADSDDPAVMSKMADFICRANYGIRNGNFELDMRDGEIRYKVFVDCDENLPNQNIVRNSIVIPSVMFERYSAGIIDVMFKDSSAEDAITKCEG